MSDENMTDAPTTGHKSGFACFVGRPNAGKSTLTNALVGGKIAITSSKPQTTRHAIRGLVNRDDAQLILIDTPGLHKPHTLLGERLNALVRSTWSEVDTIGMCLPANESVGEGDKFLMRELAELQKTGRGRRKPIFAIATKIDLVKPDRLRDHLLSIQQVSADLGLQFQEIIPVSAVADDQVDLLADLLIGTLPEGPALYPEGQLTDEPEETLIAEIVREAALEGVRDELPHSIAVVVDEMVPRPDRPEHKPLIDVRVNVYVERDSQKGIIIGKQGARLRQIGSDSRAQIEKILGTPVFLDLHVKVAKEWQRDPKQLRKLGF
jgi:GTP-binding protein Era